MYYWLLFWLIKYSTTHLSAIFSFCTKSVLESHTKQPHLGEKATGFKAQYHPEDMEVDAVVIWYEGHASYLGMPHHLSCASGIEWCQYGGGEVCGGHAGWANHPR